MKPRLEGEQKHRISIVVTFRKDKKGGKASVIRRTGVRTLSMSETKVDIVPPPPAQNVTQWFDKIQVEEHYCKADLDL